MQNRRPYPRQHARHENVRLHGNGRPAGEPHKLCAWQDCEAPAEYRAPADRQHLREYLWFCLEHVREYNRRWDYFAGMSADEIDDHRRSDVTWHRPSWPLGGSATGDAGARSDRGRSYSWHDPFEFFSDAGFEQTPPPPTEDARTRDMMRVLELRDGFTQDELKAQYKRMAKRHHPDLHNGDRAAEERLKRVIEAYAHLKQQFA